MVEAETGVATNRLIHATSPYLLQHARNPVDWYPWGHEAFAAAKAADKPIFLSVGYSTCHWCHVMAHESFEDAQVAKVLSEHFIAVKVDREQRPDVDQIYMTATQLMTGRGGWPNSVWLTPDGRPWYAGTYFPPEPRGGLPGFADLLEQLAALWRTRRSEVEAQADRLAEAVRKMSDAGGSTTAAGVLDRSVVDVLIDQLLADADRRYGGFGSAPKFPPHGALRLLMYEYKRTGREDLLAVVTNTLDAMAAGGIHDQLGGGFHRYSTDARWLVPHFEKMLYDNAQLARAYVDGWLATENPYYRRVATDVLDWVLTDLIDAGGGFHSAYDADSEGLEGKFYLWRREEIIEVLGKKDGEFFCEIYGVSDQGNYHDEATGRRTGLNIPHLPEPVGEADELRLGVLRQRLGQRRRERVWPHRDDKVLTAWNALMIGALAHAGHRLGEPRYTAAEHAADFVLEHLRADGRLLRAYRDGKAQLAGYLDDYAFMTDALLDLHEATGRARWADEARALVERLIADFHDEATGGFFFTADDHEKLLARTRSPLDRAIPSGNAVAARVLVRLAKVTGKGRYMDLARKTLEAFGAAMDKSPRGMEHLVLAAAVYFDAREADELNQPSADVVAARLGPVTAEASVEPATAAPGGSVELTVRVTVAEGFHINSARPRLDYLVATALRLAENAPATLGEVQYPPAREITLELSDQPLGVYEGSFVLRTAVTVSEQVRTGPTTLEVLLRHQACDDRRCLRPATLTLVVPVQIEPGE